jgi:hypothetical protein
MFIYKRTSYTVCALAVALTACNGETGSAVNSVAEAHTAIVTSNTPDFGPNVIIFDPSMSSTSIQSQLDTAFNSQLLSSTAQFGSQRYAFLFKPGSYSNLNANVGFYTSIAGLGQHPDDTSVNGLITVDSGWNYGDQSNATQNFWRSLENLALTPTGRCRKPHPCAACTSRAA